MIKKFFSLFKESHESFEGQQKGEQVELLLRRHRFVILLPLSFIALSTLVPPVVWDMASAELEVRGFSQLFYFVSSIWYLFVWLGAFYYLTIYALNTVIVTDHRIIQNEQLGLFNRRISELHAYRVQDVSVHIDGVVETMLHYGDIVVQTAASEKQFVFHKIPNPDRVKDEIMEIVSKHQSRLRLS